LAVAVWWPGYVRLMQAKTLALGQETSWRRRGPSGSGRLRIVLVHLLPNCVSPIVVRRA